MPGAFHPLGETRKHRAIASVLPDPELCRYVAQEFLDVPWVVRPYRTEPRFFGQAQREAEMRIDAVVAGRGFGDGNNDRGFMATFRALLLERDWGVRRQLG